jgi:hypothetical protein
MTRYTVTAENIDDVRETVTALDQRRELEVGCETWAIFYEGRQRGQMTIWPSGRGAIMNGGDSRYGDWDANARTLILDDGSDEVYDETGARVLPDQNCA